MVKGSVLERCRRAAVEFLAWSDHHAQEATARRVARGQIETHPDLNPMGNALEHRKPGLGAMAASTDFKSALCRNCDWIAG